jgi:hypothetical protein
LKIIEEEREDKKKLTEQIEKLIEIQQNMMNELNFLKMKEKIQELEV